MPGSQEILLLIGLALLLFGPNKIPEFARALGRASAEYKRGLQDVKTSLMTGEEGNTSSEDREIILAAKKLDIPTENRSIEEIASDIVTYPSDA